MRLCAAYRSSFVAKSFTEVLAELHDGNWARGEREAWESIAELIIARREEVAFEQYLDAPLVQ